MTQSAWPSLICQAYDYYFEPTAAFFGFKKACEPVHIFWDCHTNEIKVANDTALDLRDVIAEAEVYDFDGHLRWHRLSRIDVASGTAVSCFSVAAPPGLTPIYFIKLKLTGSRLLSENFYWASSRDHEYAGLSGLPKVALSGSMRREGKGAALVATISNPSSTIALMIRLRLVDGSGKRVLPVFYEDNYFSLVPGETRTVRVEAGRRVGDGEKLKLICEGWNILPAEIVQR
jgi:hypothetical protein